MSARVQELPVRGKGPATGSRAAVVMTVCALVLLGFNLRPAISSVSPLLGDLRDAFALSGTELGVLTTLPVLCLGVFAPAAPALTRRFGAEATVTGALGCVCAGILVRLVPSSLALFGGTVLAGAGLAIGNVLMPYMVRRDFPRRVGLMTGVTTMGLNVGAAVAAGATIPVRDAAGGTWQPALAVWCVPAAAAGLLWAPLAVRHAGGVEAQRRPTGVRHVLRDPQAWAVTVYMGMQSLVFYVLLSWVPEIAVARGYDQATGGLMLSLIMLLGVPASLVAPVLAGRLRNQGPVLAGAVGLVAVGLAGMLFVPAYSWFWAVPLGVGQGSCFALALTLIVLRSPDGTTSAGVSSMAQTLGYLLAAGGPLLMGVLHDATGGWSVPLAALLAWLVPEACAGLLASRPRFVRRREEGRGTTHSTAGALIGRSLRRRPGSRRTR
ncbi:MAG: CynX/NimT family MFS transporter [Streptosporangiaceae bacterium]